MKPIGKYECENCEKIKMCYEVTFDFVDGTSGTYMICEKCISEIMDKLQ